MEQKPDDVVIDDLVHLMGEMFQQALRSWDASRITEAMAMFQAVGDRLERLPDMLAERGYDLSDLLAPSAANGSHTGSTGDRAVLGREVRTLRKKLGLSQKAVGDAVGLRHTSISQIELNQGAIADETAEMVRNHLRKLAKKPAKRR